MLDGDCMNSRSPLNDSKTQTKTSFISVIKEGDENKKSTNKPNVSTKKESDHIKKSEIGNDIANTESKFDVKFCIENFIAQSEGKSCSDILKFISGVQSDILGTSE
jgi:hypothetical protein